MYILDYVDIDLLQYNHDNYNMEDFIYPLVMMMNEYFFDGEHESLLLNANIQKEKNIKDTLESIATLLHNNKLYSHENFVRAIISSLEESKIN